jgi:hypothetical protein
METRNDVMSSPCFIDSIQASLKLRLTKTDQAACWLCSNSIRSSKGCNLNYAPAAEIIGYLMEFSKNSSSPQILMDTFNGIFFFLAVENEMDKRIEHLIGLGVLNLCREYIGSSNDEILKMTMNVLCAVSRYEGQLSDSLCAPALTNEIIKIAKAFPQDMIRSLAFEIIGNMVNGTPKMRNSVIRNETEIFKPCIECLMVGSPSLRLQVLEFLGCYFLLETSPEMLRGVLDSNPDVI